MDTIKNIIDTIIFTGTIVIVKDTTHVQKIIIDQIQTSSASGNFDTISVISGAIAALAAMIAIFLTYRSNKQERESERPYITIEAPGFKQIGTALRLQITFINCGNHPASMFKGVIRIFQEDCAL